MLFTYPECALIIPDCNGENNLKIDQQIPKMLQKNRISTSTWNSRVSLAANHAQTKQQRPRPIYVLSRGALKCSKNSNLTVNLTRREGRQRTSAIRRRRTRPLLLHTSRDADFLGLPAVQGDSGRFVKQEQWERFPPSSPLTPVPSPPLPPLPLEVGPKYS